MGGKVALWEYCGRSVPHATAAPHVSASDIVDTVIRHWSPWNLVTGEVFILYTKVHDNALMVIFRRCWPSFRAVVITDYYALPVWS